MLLFPECFESIDRGMEKDVIYTHTHTYTHNGILFSKKRNEILPCVTTWTDLEGNAKWNKSDREKQLPYSFTYIWNLKYQNKNEPIETETTGVAAREEAVGDGWTWWRGMSSITLWHVCTVTDGYYN